MNDKIYELLMKLPKKNIINVMWESLDEMQAYNGRSREYCILESLGITNTVEKDGRKMYVVPSIKKIKERTENMGL